MQDEPEVPQGDEADDLARRQQAALEAELRAAPEKAALALLGLGAATELARRLGGKVMASGGTQARPAGSSEPSSARDSRRMK